MQVLEGEGAILKNREVMGATNPANAAEGTIRKEFTPSRSARTRCMAPTAPGGLPRNEIKFFFNDDEIVG